MESDTAEAIWALHVRLKTGARSPDTEQAAREVSGAARRLFPKRWNALNVRVNRERHPEWARGKAAAWKAANPEKVKAQARRRRLVRAPRRCQPLPERTDARRTYEREYQRRRRARLRAAIGQELGQSDP